MIGNTQVPYLPGSPWSAKYFRDRIWLLGFDNDELGFHVKLGADLLTRLVLGCNPTTAARALFTGLSRPNINKIFRQRIAYLTLTLLYNLIKLSIDKKHRKLIIENLKQKELYPIETPLRDRYKNLFRILFNNEFLFTTFCNIKQLFKN